MSSEQPTGVCSNCGQWKWKGRCFHDCQQHGFDDDCRQLPVDADVPNRKLTRQEQLEALADSGCDTWEEYRSER